MSRMFALTKVQRRQIQAIEEVLAPWQLTTELTKEGKHLQMRITGKRIVGEYKLTIAGTPRNDDEAVDFARQKARRMVLTAMQRAGVL